ncbi:MAG: PEP/pyruvate-binding domain-containing protein [Anaerolineales bacterium]|jgi:predicted nucleotidyltransferase
MTTPEKPIDTLLSELKERAKELNCLYKVQELLSTPSLSLDEICAGIIQAIPPGWQYPDVCQARIKLETNVYQTPGLEASPWMMSAVINVQTQPIGEIQVYYTAERPIEDEGPFLKEERKLINTIAEQFGFYILHQQLREVFQSQIKSEEERKSEWSVILDLLKRTDTALLTRVARKMINYLSWSNVEEVDRLLAMFSPVYQNSDGIGETNQPVEGGATSDLISAAEEVFLTASQHLTQEEILENTEKWIKEDRSNFLIDVLVDYASSLTEIGAAIERFHFIANHGIELTGPREQWFKVALIRRILSEQSHFIEIAQKYLDIDDFIDFTSHLIHTPTSHGKLGGKASGLFLAAQILGRTPQTEDFVKEIKTPRTWYLTSDTIFNFIGYNNFQDIVEQKYKDSSQIRQEYAYILHNFKHSPLHPEISKGLSLALDDFGDVPLIVRSSSLLEDQYNVAFAGKYKSLFLANQGSKESRMKALTEAITEVFASMFAPDPIEYRHQHHLLDHHEEMGILIQEVVGKRVGDYYLPAFAGVAFSHNDFPWSNRIKRDDGLVRLVPGLGTRAVDRLTDDYPILVAPGQPNLRVNHTLEEIIHYSPKRIDAINLKTGKFETVELRTLLSQCGEAYPLIHQLVSIVKQDQIQMPNVLGIDFESDPLVVTCEGLFTRTPILSQIKTVLDILQSALHYPVDIEFAHDGSHFYLLQCRAQSHNQEGMPVRLPLNVPQDKILFTANRHVTNGLISDITHVVYVDSQNYLKLGSQQDLVVVGRVIGLLNKILPKRQFILMGPGRWGSRGDPRLGVSVTYSDINDTAMLIEIARRQADFQPEPSFGTHFFLDLVESSIRYLPLYPDDPGILFNEDFFIRNENMLTHLLPSYEYLANVIHVVDVRTASDGDVLQVYMNAIDGEAAAVLVPPQSQRTIDFSSERSVQIERDADEHWRWRLEAVERIAARLDPRRFGVKAFYVFGSTKNATAGPQSDIDILIHVQGSDQQRTALLDWLNGWSQSLSEVNYQRTGFKSPGLLDVHLVTDDDLARRTSYALKIGAVTDPARALPLGTEVGESMP